MFYEVKRAARVKMATIAVVYKVYHIEFGGVTSPFVASDATSLFRAVVSCAGKSFSNKIGIIQWSEISAVFSREVEFFLSDSYVADEKLYIRGKIPYKV